MKELLKHDGGIKRLNNKSWKVKSMKSQKKDSGGSSRRTVQNSSARCETKLTCRQRRRMCGRVERCTAGDVCVGL
jgi:hypothetical protein